MNFIVPSVRDQLSDDTAAAGPLILGVRRGCWLHGHGSGCNAKASLHPQRLYREQGENIKHHYTQTADLPEVLLAKLNAMNISEVKLPKGMLGRGGRAGRLPGHHSALCWRCGGILGSETGGDGVPS